MARRTRIRSRTRSCSSERPRSARAKSCRRQSTRLFTGVEVQATVADNLLQRDFVRRPEDGVAVETLAVIALGVFSIVLVGRFGVAWGALGAAAGVAALWGGAGALMSTTGAFLSPLFPTLGVAAALAAMTMAQSTLERVRADRAGREKATAQRVMVQALLSLVEIRDVETGRHSRRTQQYTRVLAEALASHPDFSEYLTPERIELLSTLAPLHDIGKVGVPDRVLNKPGSAHGRRAGRDAEASGARPRCHSQNGAGGRRSRRHHARHRQGHRLHAP